MPNARSPRLHAEADTRPSRFSRQLELLQEAQAVEAAGGLWTQAQAAAVLNVSVSTLRASDCPDEQYTARGHGKRRIVRYDPVQVRAWRAKGERRATVPQKRAS